MDGEDYWEGKYPSQSHYLTEVCEKYNIGVETLRKDFGVMKRMGTYKRYKEDVIDKNPFLSEED